MITNNTMLDMNLLKNLIGKKLKWIKHDKFVITPDTYGVAYLNIDDIIYSLTDFYEVKNVLGDDIEISVLKMQVDNNELTEATVDLKKACQNFNSTITSITIVNAITKLLNDDNLFDSIYDTQGIIFTLENNYELSFEKDDFGENITIYRGYNLKKKFQSIPNYIIEGFDVPKTDISCTLEYIEIK